MYPMGYTNDKMNSKPTTDSSCVVFVGDLSSICTEHHLAAIFRDEGFQILDAKIIRGKNSSLSLNYGFVLMRNILEANKAISTLDSKLCYGRKIRVSLSKPQAKGPKTNDIVNSVHVKFQALEINITVTEITLREVFSVFGVVTDAWVKRSVVAQVPGARDSGYGFVHFEEGNDGMNAALKAIELMSNKNIINNVEYLCEPSRNLLKRMQTLPLGQYNINLEKYRHTYNNTQKQMMINNNSNNNSFSYPDNNNNGSGGGMFPSQYNNHSGNTRHYMHEKGSSNSNNGGGGMNTYNMYPTNNNIGMNRQDYNGTRSGSSEGDMFNRPLGMDSQLPVPPMYDMRNSTNSSPMYTPRMYPPGMDIPPSYNSHHTLSVTDPIMSRSSTSSYDTNEGGSYHMNRYQDPYHDKYPPSRINPMPSGPPLSGGGPPLSGGGPPYPGWSLNQAQTSFMSANIQMDPILDPIVTKYMSTTDAYMKHSNLGMSNHHVSTATASGTTMGQSKVKTEYYLNFAVYYDKVAQYTHGSYILTMKSLPNVEDIITKEAFECQYNSTNMDMMAELEVLSKGLNAVLDRNIHQIKVLFDNEILFRQVQACSPQATPVPSESNTTTPLLYHIKKLMKEFYVISFEIITKSENRPAFELAFSYDHTLNNLSPTTTAMSKLTSNSQVNPQTSYSVPQHLNTVPSAVLSSSPEKSNVRSSSQDSYNVIGSIRSTSYDIHAPFNQIAPAKTPLTSTELNNNTVFHSTQSLHSDHSSGSSYNKDHGTVGSYHSHRSQPPLTVSSSSFLELSNTLNNLSLNTSQSQQQQQPLQSQQLSSSLLSSPPPYYTTDRTSISSDQSSPLSQARKSSITTTSSILSDQEYPLNKEDDDYFQQMVFRSLSHMDNDEGE